MEPPRPKTILPPGRDEKELVEEQMSLPVEHVRTYEHELDYRNKLVLAPMVRSGSCKLVNSSRKSPADGIVPMVRKHSRVSWTGADQE
jgi:hypothetical protein